MKKTTGERTRLGIFVIVSLSLFVACIYFIGQRQQLFSKTFHISGIFQDIGGLQVGNSVRFSGINVGVVSSIEQLTDTTVRVEMSVNEQTRKFIKMNATAMIGTDGLMGNKLVLIIPGSPTARVINDNDIIATSHSVSMDEILVKIKETSDNAAGISTDLAVLVHNIRMGKGTIGKLFADSAFANTIDATMVNIKQGAGGFKKNMDAASHNIFLRGFLKKKKSKKDD